MLFIGTEIFASILLATAVPEEILDNEPLPIQQVQPDGNEQKNSTIVRLPNPILIDGFYYDCEDAFYFYDLHRKRRYPKHKYYIKDGKQHHRIITPVRARFTPAFRRYPKPKGVKHIKRRPLRKPGPPPGKGGPPRRPPGR